MAAKITGASLQPILLRLNNAPTYHPFEADAFSDWSTEAGDIITVSRGSDTYTSPANVTRMVWKGNAPTVQISSTGNKEREPIAKVSRKKYGRGSAGIRSQEGIFRNFTSEDGILHSSLAITESYLRTEFHNEAGSLRSYFDMTSSHLRTEFIDEVHSLRGDFEVTVSHMRTEFTDEVSSLHGEFEVTVSHMRTEFIDNVNSLRGDFEVTVSHMRTEFTDGVNSVRSEFEVTATHLRNEFIDEVNSVRSYTEQTASSWETRVEGVVDANGNVTAASIALAVNNAGSSVKINANKIYLLGQTIMDTVDANYLSTQIATIPTLTVQTIAASGTISAGTLNADTIRFRHGGGAGYTYTDLKTAFVSSISLTQSGNTYTLKSYDANANETVIGTFSRATTLSAGWDGNRKFTVGATPQNVSRYTTLMSAIPNANVTWDGTTATIALKATIDEGETAIEVGNVTMNIANFLQDKTGTAKITSNGLYSAGSGYVGFGDIEIDVPQSTVEPTSVGIQWDGSRKLIATANPQGVSRYTTIVSAVPNANVTWNGTTATLALKATYDDGETTVDVGSVTTDVSGKLQSKTVTSNGTVTPGSGYIGLSSVTVNVPTTNARAHFGATSGQYYIEAVDTVSGNPIPDSSVNYSLIASGSNVTISAGSGQTVPSIALGINSGSLSNGSRTLTVTAGGSNTTATVTITDYSAGWTAAYGKVSLPANNTSTGFMVVETPPSTVGGNATSTTYTLDTADKNIAYIKQGSSVKAQVTHNKYNSGWTAAYNKVTLPANGTGTTMVVKTPPSTVDGNATSTTYTLSSDNNVAYIKVGNDVKAQLTHNKYSNGYTAGWHAYYNTMHFPSSGTTSTMSVYWPGYTPDSSWDSVQRDYVLSSDNNTCYLKYGSTTMAQLTHNKYTNGYNSARLSLNTSTKVISKSSSGDVTQYTLALMSDSRITTSGSDYGKRKVWIKATPNSGNAVEVSSTTLSDYRDGWTAAYNKVSIPSSSNTSTNYMTVKTPPSTVGGSADETKYYVTSDDSYAYLRKGSTSGTAVARGTNNAYGNGKSAVWNGVTIGYGDATWRYENSSSLTTLAIYMKTPFTVSSSGMTTKSYNPEWSAKPTEIYRAGWNAGWNAFYDDSPDWIKDWDEGGGVKSVWTPRKTSSYNYYSNNGKGTGSSATCQEWFRYSSGSSPSHSISQSHAVASDLASLANNLGASGSSQLTDLGTFSAAGGRNYWGIRVSCGGAVKYYYVRAT